MDQDLKMKMRRKARLAKGLVNLLRDDAEQMCIDVEDSDVFSLDEAIHEAKRTAQHIIDVATELEYYLYLAKRDS